MNHTKQVFKSELDDCTKEFERQLNELNLQMKKLIHQSVVLETSKQQNSRRHEKLHDLLAMHKQR